jgi:hypothetical protein
VLEGGEGEGRGGQCLVQVSWLGVIRLHGCALGTVGVWEVMKSSKKRWSERTVSRAKIAKVTKYSQDGSSDVKRRGPAVKSCSWTQGEGGKKKL